MELNKAFHLFMREKEASCSEQTYIYYSGNLQRFLNYVEDVCQCPADILPVDVIDKALLVAYVSYLRKKISFSGNPAVHCERKIKSTSVHSYMRAVKIFVRWCYHEGYIHSDVSQHLKLPRPDPEQIIPLYHYEVDLIDAQFDLNTELGLRNLCIVHLMLDAGLRLSEVVRLRIADVAFDLNLLYIHGKGSKYRVVPLCSRLHKILFLYRARYRDVSVESQHLDISFFVREFPEREEPITANTIKQLFRKLQQRTDIIRLHPHLLRHTFATSYIMGGGNLEFLRVIMGHSDYGITKNYIRLAYQFRIIGADIYQLDSVFFKSAY